MAVTNPTSMAPWSELIRRGLSIANESASDALQFAQKNPGMAFAAVAGAGGLTVLAMPGVAVVPTLGILNVVGFGSAGIVPGSIAASAQAAIGNVAAGSAFATLTSAGAGGYGVATLVSGAQAAGGAILGTAGTAAAFAKVRTAEATAAFAKLRRAFTKVELSDEVDQATGRKRWTRILKPASPLGNYITEPGRYQSNTTLC